MRILISIALSFVFVQLYAQDNLVPDPGFDKFKTDTCYYDNCDLVKQNMKHWIVPADYDSAFFIHHSCDDDYYNRCGAPRSNFFNYQEPRSEPAYAELLITDKDYIPAHYLMCPLIEPLKEGQKYYLEFWVNNPGTDCDKQYFTHKATNSIAASFTGQPISPLLSEESKSAFQNLEAYVANDEDRLLTDTAGWTKVSGTFTAKGYEKYLLLGNLFSSYDVSVETCMGMKKSGLFVNGNEVWAILFIDDVTLYAIDKNGKPTDVHKQAVDAFKE